MPVLSDRADVIVITDEAHRSQYDTLALNMRRALPERGVHGVHRHAAGRRRGADPPASSATTSAIYNFRDAIEDGATVPLYYENRIPELQLVNEDFADELTALLEEAELDEDAEGRLARRFGREYALITRPERLRTVARDLVRHFVGRGFAGKAMYVGDRQGRRPCACTTSSRRRGPSTSPSCGPQHDALPELERPWLASRIELMETTDMAVVVSQAQNEIADLERQGLDIRPHRARMNAEELDEQFKDADDPLRLVFVCAMWMTGFDAPSVLDDLPRPPDAQPHADADDRPRQPGVPRQGQRADRRLHRRVPRPRAGARHLRRGQRRGRRRLPDPGQGGAGRRARRSGRRRASICARATTSTSTSCAPRRASSSSPCATPRSRRCSSTKRCATEFLAAARQARKLFKAVLPDPAAAAHQATVAVIRVLAERIADARPRPAPADLDDVAGCRRRAARPVGRRRGVRDPGRRRGHRTRPADRPVADRLRRARRPVRRPQARRDRPARRPAPSSERSRAARRNPTRYDLVERIEELIAEYNAGSLNIDEYLRRLDRALPGPHRRGAAEPSSRT